MATPHHDPDAPEPQDAPPTGTDQDLDASTEVMSLLVEHVPLTLLADLASPTGPASPAILEAEGLPDVAWWDAEEDDGLPDLVPDEPDEPPGHGAGTAAGPPPGRPEGPGAGG